eukprot:RCo025804
MLDSSLTRAALKCFTSVVARLLQLQHRGEAQAVLRELLCLALATESSDKPFAEAQQPSSSSSSPVASPGLRMVSLAGRALQNLCLGEPSVAALVYQGLVDLVPQISAESAADVLFLLGEFPPMESCEDPENALLPLVRNCWAWCIRTGGVATEHLRASASENAVLTLAEVSDATNKLRMTLGKAIVEGLDWSHHSPSTRMALLEILVGCARGLSGFLMVMQHMEAQAGEAAVAVSSVTQWLRWVVDIVDIYDLATVPPDSLELCQALLESVFASSNDADVGLPLYIMVSLQIGVTLGLLRAAGGEEARKSLGAELAAKYNFEGSLRRYNKRRKDFGRVVFGYVRVLAELSEDSISEPVFSCAGMLVEHLQADPEAHLKSCAVETY